jgi:hypothetical protein
MLLFVYFFISTPQRFTNESLNQKNRLFDDGVTFFFQLRNTSLSALNVNTSYPDASTAAVSAVLAVSGSLLLSFKKDSISH